jgi:L,D-transpeptidase catalytic domain
MGFLKKVMISAAFVLALAGAANADILININKATQRMTVFVNGVQRYNWPVSTGKPGYATPSGSFSIFRMEKTYFSKEWDDAPMPNAMFFTAAGNAIHGTYSTGRLGSAVSHGCVRLAPANAAKLYAMVQAAGGGSFFGGGAEVVITGPSPGLPPGVHRQVPPGLAKKKLQTFPLSDLNWLK